MTTKKFTKKNYSPEMLLPNNLTDNTTDTNPKNIPQKPSRKNQIMIIEDTREQRPLTDWPEGVTVQRQTLATGDYSIVGYENCFCVERKSLVDFAGTMINGFQSNPQNPPRRFNNELQRMQHYDCACIVVVATPEEVLKFHYHNGQDAHGALWNFALSIFSNYHIPVFMLGSEKVASKWIADLARHYVVSRTKKNMPRSEKAVWSF